MALAAGVRLGANSPTAFRGVNAARAGRLIGGQSDPEITTVRPLLDDTEASILREDEMSILNELFEENPKLQGTLESSLMGALNFSTSAVLDQQPLGGSLNFTPGILDERTRLLGDLPYPDHSLHPLPLPPPPATTVRQVELPPPAPGCRSIATTTCHHRPVVIPRSHPQSTSFPRKVAYEKCRRVPAVDCFYVLKTVPDVECSPETYEDCIDLVKEVRSSSQYMSPRSPILSQRKSAWTFPMRRVWR